jgi:hypothetical protein
MLLNTEHMASRALRVCKCLCARTACGRFGVLGQPHHEALLHMTVFTTNFSKLTTVTRLSTLWKQSEHRQEG